MFIVEKSPRSVAAETYRTLRTNIQYSSFDKEYKSILITSSDPAEGKSTTAGNLALAYSQGESKVLLIDCDLRRPSLHKKFRVSNLIGLSDVLLGKAKLDEIMYKHNENLHVLTSGKVPPNPAEMLGSKSMKEFIEKVKGIYDCVILDAPPILAVTDAQILSTKVDGTVIVVRADKTKKEAVNGAIQLLKKVNANVIGTVLNDVDNSNNKYYYYYGDSKTKSSVVSANNTLNI